jgi:hypothetical protein
MLHRAISAAAPRSGSSFQGAFLSASRPGNHSQESASISSTKKPYLFAVLLAETAREV